MAMSTILSRLAQPAADAAGCELVSGAKPTSEEGVAMALASGNERAAAEIIDSPGAPALVVAHRPSLAATLPYPSLFTRERSHGRKPAAPVTYRPLGVRRAL
jgi:hypothetical protein